MSRFRLFVACARLSAQDLPAGAGRDTLKKVCTQCHDIDSVPRLRYSNSDWTNLVYSMKDMGADATSAELDEIIDYLTARNFGKGDEVKKANVNSASAKEIESGSRLHRQGIRSDRAIPHEERQLQGHRRRDEG